MNLSLDKVSDNLLEIDYSIKHNHGFIANWSETRLYDANLGWGRLWRWFYNMVALFTRQDRRQEKFCRTVEKTHHAFKEQIEILKERLKGYQSYLNKVSNEFPVDEEELRAGKKNLSFWSNRILGCLSLSENSRIKSINQIFNSVLAQDLIVSEEKELFSEVKRYQKIIDVEENLYCPFPFAALARLSTDRKLTLEQNRALDRWISKINGAKKQIDIRGLHRALFALVQHMNYTPSGEGVKKAELALLEWKLQLKGCTLFNQIDQQHKQWKEHLQSGDRLECNGKEFILGEKLEDRADQALSFYALQGDPSKGIAIAKNEAYLGIYRQRQKEQGWGIPLAEIFEIDARGVCALQERLNTSLGSYVWTSKTYKLTEQDEKEIKPIEVFLRWLCQENHTPIPFSPDTIRWDQKGNLKTTELLSKGKFDFNKLENFVSNCAAGNRYIYQHLMHQSGLAAHPTNRFYRKVLIDTLGGKKVKIEEEAAFHKIADPHCIDKAIEMRAEVFRLKTRCCDRILDFYQVPKGREGLEKFVADQLLTQLEEGEIISLQEASLVDTVIESILRFKRYKMREDVLQQRIKKICEKVDEKAERKGLLQDRNFYSKYGIYHFQQINDVMADLLTTYSHAQ